jgi:hypothetical protein
MIFAATDPTPAQLGIWIGCAFLLLNFLTCLLTLIKQIRDDPEKRQVSITPNVATKEDLGRHVEDNRQEHQNIFAKIGGVERGLREEIKKDVGHLSDKISDVSADVTGLNKTNELQNQRLVHMDAKLDRLIERTPKNKSTFA